MLCTVFGNLLDSGLEPLNGILVVTLDSAITNDAGDSIERYSREFPIESGIININLESSEDLKVTYHFEFFRLIPDNEENDPEYETRAEPDFRAIVPKLPAYPWGQLRLGTGITTINLSTAALVVAKEMLTNPNIQPILFDSLGLFKTALPPLNAVEKNLWLHPVTSDFFIYSELDSEWLTEVKSQTISLSNLDDNETGVMSINLIDAYDKIRLDSIVINFRQLAPLTVNDYFQIRAGFIPPNTTSETVVATINTSNSVAGQNFTQNFVINQNLLYTEINRFFVEAQKFGTSGDLQAADITFNYKYRY